MTWIIIPNDSILSFTGRPIQLPLRDDDWEIVYKPVKCPGCQETYTSLQALRVHSSEEHPEVDLASQSLTLTQEQVDATPPVLVIEFLLTFNALSQSQGLLGPVRRQGDAFQSTELWRRASLAHQRGESLRLKPDQYRWLTNFLERKVPLTKAERESLDAEEKPEARTVADVLYGLSAYNVQQALLIPSERRVVVPDDDAEET